MGQQPNIELEISSLPRPRLRPAPARRWRPDRPGDLDGPLDVPWGGAFGTTGPDAGYALRLIRDRGLTVPPGEDPYAVEQVVAAVTMARASYNSRAPIGEDVDVALTVLGLNTEALSESAIADLGADRAKLTAGAAHDAAKVRVAAEPIPNNLLSADLDTVIARLEDGQRLDL